MAEEIQEAVQIIRVAYDGIEIAMKVGSGGLGAMQKAIDFLKGMLDYEKSLGKTSVRQSKPLESVTAVPLIRIS